MKTSNKVNRFRPKLLVKKGDMVAVISGDDKDRAKARRVLEVFPADGRALVEGVNMVSRHTKPSAKNTQGGIVKKEAPIQISKLMLLDPKGGKPTRVGRKVVDGKLVRYAKGRKSSGEIIK